MRALVVALLLAGGSARADSTRTETYGETIAVCDAISVAVLATGMALIVTDDRQVSGGATLGIAGQF